MSVTTTHPPSTTPIVGTTTAHDTNPLTHIVVGIGIVLVVLAATIGLIVGQALGAHGAEPAADVAMNRPQSDMYAAMAEVAAVDAYLAGVAQQEADARAAAARAATTTVAPARAEVHADPADPGVWDQLAQCETGGNWATDSVPGFAGGLGFANSTWSANGGGEFAQIAADATREQQIVIAQRVLAGSGWGAWPGCSSLLGLR